MSNRVSFVINDLADFRRIGDPETQHVVPTGAKCGPQHVAQSCFVHLVGALRTSGFIRFRRQLGPRPERRRLKHEFDSALFDHQNFHIFIF
jgi:hypothetical protein